MSSFWSPLHRSSKRRFFVRQEYKPANPVRTEVRTFCAPTIPPTPALAGHLARLATQLGANRKPCKPRFLVRR